MATLDQVSGLIRNHYLGESDKFRTVSLQIASHEANLGRHSFAEGVRKLINNTTKAPNVIPFKENIAALFISPNKEVGLEKLVQSKEVLAKINRVIDERTHKQKLSRYNLTPITKLLLTGPSGTGKTMTAAALANALKLPLYIVRWDMVISSYLGGTSSKLRLVFDAIQEHEGVYFFDEFDAIGGKRNLGTDVGEMRRITNTLLQFIEGITSSNYIIAATNNKQILDDALFRRFDDVISYSLPDRSLALCLIQKTLGVFLDQTPSNLERISIDASLSYADIEKSCFDSMKDAILADQTIVLVEDLNKKIEKVRQHSV